MIVYQLGCPNGHYFEGWFASAEACARMRLFVSGSAPLLAETHRQFQARTGHRIL